jgi:hypothetical protein
LHQTLKITKMKTQKVFFLVVVLILIVCTQACEKKEQTVLAPETAKNIALSNAIAETNFSDVFDQTQEAVEKSKDLVQGGKNFFAMDSICATISIVPFDLVSFPKTIIVDFGELGCVGNDGKLRKGKIQIQATGWFKDSSSVITVTLDNYFVNGFKVEGTKTITNNGKNSNNNLNFSVIVQNGKVTSPDNKVVQWESNRQIEWIAGEETMSAADDEYKITGTQSGVTAANESYTIQITVPIHIVMSCQWRIVAGKQKITSGEEEILIDYGDGTCDDKFIVTYKGLSYVVTMP